MEKKSLEANKEVVRRLFEEVWNDRQLGVANEVLVDDYAERERAWATTVLESFPDTHFTIEGSIAEGNQVWTHVVWRATHRGEFAGIPATGKAVELPSVFIHQVEDGKCVSLVFGGAAGIVDRIKAAIADK